MPNVAQTPASVLQETIEVLNARISGDEYEARCPGHEDRKASLTFRMNGNSRLLFQCHAGCGDGKDFPRLLAALRDVGVPPTALPGTVGDTASQGKQKRPGGRSGSHSPRAVWRPLSDRDEDRAYRLHERLMADRERLDELWNRRRLTPEMVSKALLGWDGYRYWIPVFGPNGQMVNVRKHRLGATDDERKVLNVKGHGDKRQVYPVSVLAECEDVLLVEGELDSLTAIDHGIPAVSVTAGARSSLAPEVVALFAGKRVAVLFDNDKPGQSGAQAAANMLRAATAVKVLRWPKWMPEHGDVTDYFLDGRGSARRLRGLMDEPAETAAPQEMDLAALGVRRLSDVQTKRVRWLWRGWLAYGKIAISEGDPGLGKSTMTLDIAARYTVGAPMPGEDEGCAPGNVLLVGNEDDLGDTVKPRILAHGGDPDRVFSMDIIRKDDDGNVVPLSIPDDLERIEQAARTLGATLLIIDPITAFLSEHINSHNDASTRRALAPVGQTAERLGAAVVLVRHLRKESTAKAVYRGGGSIAFTGAARTVMVVDKEPGNPDRVIVASSKINVGVAPKSLAYLRTTNLEYDCLKIVWDGTVDITADQLMSGGDSRKDAPRRREAEALILELLADGRRGAAVMEDERKAAAFSKETWENAKKNLGVISERSHRQDGTTEEWTWFLPDQPGA